MSEHESELEEIRGLARNFMSPKEVAMIRGYDVDDFEAEVEEGTSERAMAYHGGHLLTKCALNESILTMALRCSSPAQAQALEILKQLRRT